MLLGWSMLRGPGDELSRKPLVLIERVFGADFDLTTLRWSFKRRFSPRARRLGDADRRWHPMPMTGAEQLAAEAVPLRELLTTIRLTEV